MIARACRAGRRDRGLGAIWEYSWESQLHFPWPSLDVDPRVTCFKVAVGHDLTRRALSPHVSKSTDRRFRSVASKLRKPAMLSTARSRLVSHSAETTERTDALPRLKRPRVRSQRRRGCRAPDVEAQGRSDHAQRQLCLSGAGIPILCSARVARINFVVSTPGRVSLGRTARRFSRDMRRCRYCRELRAFCLGAAAAKQPDGSGSRDLSVVTAHAVHAARTRSAESGRSRGRSLSKTPESFSGFCAPEGTRRRHRSFC